MESVTTRAPRKGNQRVMMVASLDTLVGAHPEALRDMYALGEAADSTALGGARDGRLLTIERLSSAFVLSRPFVRALSRSRLFAGKSFESGGTAGRDRFLNGERFRFRCERGPSLLDGRPTLIMRYDGLGNAWPLAAAVDELRVVAGVGIGFRMSSPGRRGRILYWWGLDLEPPKAV